MLSGNCDHDSPTPAAEQTTILQEGEPDSCMTATILAVESAIILGGETCAANKPSVARMDASVIIATSGLALPKPKAF